MLLLSARASILPDVLLAPASLPAAFLAFLCSMPALLEEDGSLLLLPLPLPLPPPTKLTNHLSSNLQRVVKLVSEKVY